MYYDLKKKKGIYATCVIFILQFSCNPSPNVTYKNAINIVTQTSAIYIILIPCL